VPAGPARSAALERWLRGGQEGGAVFVQVIEGVVADRDGLRRQMDRWASHLRPGAEGFLGTTAGVAADGRSIAFARFASPEAAAANGARPEQDAWWSETEKCYEGPVSFTDSTDVEEFLGGGDDSAGFVQFMKVTVPDRERMRELDRIFESKAPEVRPDLLGGLRVWVSPDSYIEAGYFTSEAEAREGESKEMPPELQEMWSEFGSTMAAAEFVDISEPWLYAP
jgi:hypothetical protein